MLLTERQTSKPR